MLKLSVAACSLSVLLVGFATSSRAASVSAATHPAFLWSSAPVFSKSADQQSSRISHEVKDANFLFGLVDALIGHVSSDCDFVDIKDKQKLDSVIVLVGQSDKAGNVLDSRNAAETAPLRQAMAASASSLALPFLHNEGGDLPGSWQAHLQQAGVSSSLVGSCDQATDASSTAALSPEAATQGIQAALSKSSQVILVCSGEQATLKQEMQLLEAATVAAGSSSAVFGFIVQPHQGAGKPVGRSLLEASGAAGSVLRLPTDDDLASIAASREATAAAREELARNQFTGIPGLTADSKLTPAGFKPAPGGLRPASLPVRPGNQGSGDTPFQGLVCDDKCQVQVTMIEVAILGFTVISALVSGSWLMHGVGTPTRFEKSKESQHGQ